MADDPLFLVVAASVLFVLAVLMAGLGTFLKGGEFNRRYSNKIMRLRVLAQLVAVVLILAFVLVRRQGG